MQAFTRTSRITPPRLQRIVERSRLLDTLEREREKRLVFVLGQAAQGKSTLVASYSQRCKRPSAWVNLSPEESDPVNLFLLVVRSAQYALKSDSLSKVIDYVGMDMGPRAETPLYRGWVQALVARISSPIQVILDGLDRLQPGSPSFRLLRVLIDEATSTIRLIIVSRTEPPFEIHNLKMRQQAAVLDNDQLAFTLEETQTFFRDGCNLSLPAGKVEKIHALTEGWVGGLLLFSEALKRRPKNLGEQLLSEEFIAEFKRDAFRYLGDEIFSLLPEHVREFLVKTSILEVIHPALAKEFPGTADAESILQELSKRNLFIQSLYDEKNGWSFRYHQMFRDFLRTRFESETTREQRRRLFAEAGYVHEQAEEYERALDFYLQAKAYPEASRVLERIGMDLLKSGRVGDLGQRLRSLPGDLVQQNPWLLYYLCMTRRYTASKENARALLDCLGIFEKTGDTRGQILCLAFLIETCLLAGYHTVPIKDLIAKAEKLLESIPWDSYGYESALLWLQVGQGWTVSCGNPRKGFWTYKKAYLIAGYWGDINLQGLAMSRAVEALAWLGEFDSADELCLELEELVGASPYPELQAYYLIALATLSEVRGEIQKAREQVGLARSVVEKYGLIFWYPIVLVLDLWASVFGEELERAEDIANHLLNLASSTGNRMFEGMARVFSALISLRKGDRRKAKETIDHSIRILSSEESLAIYHCRIAIVVRSLILHFLEEEFEEKDELQKVIDEFTNIPGYLLLIDAHMVMAFRQKESDRPDKAKQHLKTAFRLAQEKKHYHTVLLSREDFADACVLALELDVGESAGYASYLLSTHLSDLADSRIKRLEAHPNTKIASQARQLRKAIYYSGLPRLRIQCFGNFQVLRGDQPIEDGEWQRAQPRNLLKALVARGARQASREALMEDLWPESNARASEMNFKVTLHRLRKVLEPGLDKSYGSSYLHLKDNRLYLDKDLCTVDVEDFLVFTGNGQKQEAEGKFKEALAWYVKAVELYRGDFLETDLYLPWAEIKREGLRRRYVKVLFKMASLWENQGKNKTKKAIECCQRVLQAEPFMEEACQKIMLLYAKRGMRNAALRTYAKYKKSLKAGLDTEPDKVTTAIFRKIAEDAK